MVTISILGSLKDCARCPAFHNWTAIGISHLVIDTHSKMKSQLMLNDCRGAEVVLGLGAGSLSQRFQDT